MTIDFSTPTTELIDKLKQLKFLRESIKELEEALEKEKECFATLEKECVLLMDNNSVTKIRVDGATMFRRTDNYISVNKEQKDDAFQWLREKDLGYLIQETVNAKSLTSAITTLKENEGEDVEIPPCINQSKAERIGIRKG